MSSEIARRLSDQAKLLVSRFEDRVDSFSGREDLLRLTRELDAKDANEYARSYFGEGDYHAYGIDGSMGYDERLQMMLFYANATAYSCPFHVGDEISFDLKNARREGRFSSTAAVPLWSEDFSDVLPETSEIDLELEHSVERIPNAFMTLGELYLATKTIENARVLFMDRPLSGTYSTLSRDARLLLKKGTSNLTKLGYDGIKISILDLRLAIYLGDPKIELPSRRRFLLQRIVRALMDDELSFQELSKRLSVSVAEIEKASRRVEALDKKHDGELLSNSTTRSMVLRGEVKGYWDRAVNLATTFARSVFEEGAHPLSVADDEWLTVLDVNTLSFVLLVRLCELAKKTRALVIGIAKDTTATDISRAVLPLAVQRGLRMSEKAPKLKNDRAFLTILAGANDALGTPWRTIGYDSALSTMISSPSEKGVFSPARKYVSRERLFVRGFFQIRTLGDRGKIRSKVFLFDRVYEDSEDSSSVTQVEVREPSGVTRVEPYLERTSSRVSNVALRILSLNDNPEVYEAFGHNQLLYLADKAVKAEIRLMRSSLRGVADLRLGAMSRRERLYGIASSYREERTEMEESRRAASRGE